MSTETELTNTFELTGIERRLLAELLVNEWHACDRARRPFAVGNDGLVLRQHRIESIQRKLGYFG